MFDTEKFSRLINSLASGLVLMPDAQRRALEEARRDAARELLQLQEDEYSLHRRLSAAVVRLRAAEGRSMPDGTVSTLDLLAEVLTALEKRLCPQESFCDA